MQKLGGFPVKSKLTVSTIKVFFQVYRGGSRALVPLHRYTGGAAAAAAALVVVVVLLLLLLHPPTQPLVSPPDCLPSAADTTSTTTSSGSTTSSTGGSNSSGGLLRAHHCRSLDQRDGPNMINRLLVVRFLILKTWRRLLRTVGALRRRATARRMTTAWSTARFYAQTP